MYESEFITNIKGKEKRKPETFFPEPPPASPRHLHLYLLSAPPRASEARRRPPALGGARRGTAPGDRRGVCGNQASVGLEMRLEVGRPHEVQSGPAITCVPLVAAPSRGASKPRQGIYLSGDAGRPASPGRWRGSSPRSGGALPACPSCGVFANSHASFCCCYKDSVFIRCCDLRYTNPLKKTRMKSPAGKVESNEVGCREAW